MSDATVLLYIGASILAGTIVPGPSFIVVLRAGLNNRRSGLLVSLGVATASVFFACLALAGLVVLLAQMPSLYWTFKLVGGLYLCHLAWRLWRPASERALPSSSPMDTARKPIHQITYGAATQASNPKAALVYASTFAAFLPPEPNGTLGALIVMEIFLISALWYGLVAVAASARPIAAVYLGSRRLVDRFAAAIIGGLGLNILLRTLSDRPA